MCVCVFCLQQYQFLNLWFQKNKFLNSKKEMLMVYHFLKLCSDFKILVALVLVVKAIVRKMLQF